MKRNRWALVFYFVVLFFSLGLLYMLYGPSSPAGKAVETFPSFPPGNPPESLTGYLEEFNRLRTSTPSPPQRRRQFLGGTVLHQDSLPKGGAEIVLTYGGNSWTENQQLHYRKDTNATWNTLQSPVRAASKAYLLKSNEVQRVLLEGNKSLLVYDLLSGKNEKLLPGRSVSISPDRRWASAYEVIDEFGYYSLAVIDLDTLQIRKPFSIWEADPGSGISFYCNWSADSKALEFHGDVRLVDENQDIHSAPIRKVRYIYYVDNGELYDLSGAP